MHSSNSLRILYVNVIENNAGWGAEWFIHRGFQALGHQTHCIDFRKHRARLPELLRAAPPYDIFFLQRGDYVPLPWIRCAHAPRLFWASELVERCRDQDPLLRSDLFDHVFFHSQRCIEQVVSQGWLERSRCSVLLNGFDEALHRPLSEGEKKFDVLFVGTLTRRRQLLLEKLKTIFTVQVASAFGEELIRLFNQARIVLNLHAEEAQDVETRVFEALGCGAFLLSEKLSEENPFDQRHLVVFDSFSDLCQKIDFYLSHEIEREQIAAQGRREALAHHTYAHRAAEIEAIMKNCLQHRSMRPAQGLVFQINPGSFQTGGNRWIFTPGRSPSQAKNGRPVKTTGQRRLLRIFAAFSQTNWEDYNLQPGLAQCGEVVRFDWKDRYNQYDAQWHWSQKQRMNLELLDAFYRAHRQKAVDLFFGYLSGRLVFPGFIRTIRRLGIPTLNISLDDKAKFYGELEPTGYSGMADIASAFSLCWTTDKSALLHYQAVGAKALYLPAAANPDIFRPLDLPKTLDVVFVGQKYGQRNRIVEQLAEQGITVHTYGAGWKKGPVPIEEMVRLFNQSKIVLGINLVADSPHLISLKGRDFEVPMCGALYLTQANPDLAEFFQIGKEIVCYDSMPDLVDKIRHYLSHPREAKDIRRAARSRSFREHTWSHRFQAAFEKLDLADPPHKPRSQTAVKTSDDWTYYLRENQKEAGPKREIIKSFVLSHPDIRSILDVGCNNGFMSVPFLEHGLEVLGLDASQNLRLPPGYHFVPCDITRSHAVFMGDGILFLSLYHHLFRSQGAEFCDALFLKFLLRSKYLIFDCGNVAEKGPDRQSWTGALKVHFASEKELLDHFGLPYEIIGAWQTGGSSRSIVVFRNRAFDRRVEVLDEFRRPVGGRSQEQGLTPVKDIRDFSRFFDRTRFFKLALGGRRFFAKKHLSAADEASEFENIREVYRAFPQEELIPFYGRSEEFGLIFEWLDDFRYLGKVRGQELHGVRLHDADRIEVAGRVKYIDFWSDPAKKPVASNQPLLGEADRWLRIGEDFFQSNQCEKAAQCFRAILARDPYHPEALNNLGVIAFQQGAWDQAVDCFRQVLHVRPDYPDALENMGHCHLQAKDFQSALHCFQQALKAGAPSVDVLNQIGYCFTRLGNKAEALETYRSSLRLNPQQSRIIEIVDTLDQTKRPEAKELSL